MFMTLKPFRGEVAGWWILKTEGVVAEKFLEKWVVPPPYASLGKML